MKAKIVHHNITRINPAFSKTVYQSLKPGLQQMMYVRNTPRVIPQTYGDVIEHEDSYLLVLMGMATPVDDECIEAAGLAQSQIDEKIIAYAKQSKASQTGISALDADPEEEDEEGENDELFD